MQSATAVNYNRVVQSHSLDPFLSSPSPEVASNLQLGHY
jgi:hypothetical protein